MRREDLWILALFRRAGPGGNSVVIEAPKVVVDFAANSAIAMLDNTRHRLRLVLSAADFTGDRVTGRNPVEGAANLNGRSWDGPLPVKPPPGSGVRIRSRRHVERSYPREIYPMTDKVVRASHGTNVPASRYLSSDAAARYLGASSSTLAKWRVAGSGPKYYRLGSAIRYTEHDLDAFMMARAAVSTSEYNTAA